MADTDSSGRNGATNLSDSLNRLNNRRLESYRVDPGLLKEHSGIEETVMAGGYGYRQIMELVQNGADALLEAQGSGEMDAIDGRIHVQLSAERLYVANTGAPLTEEGLDSLLRSHSSPKRGNQIGRFGLGFKSLLKLNGRIDIFTRSSGAIRFDPERCRDELRSQFQVADAPGLRLAWPLPQGERSADPVASELTWAETIVRIEIGSESLLEHIRQEIQSFPAEFLLFFPVTAVLRLDDGAQPARQVRVAVEGEDRVLHNGESSSRWRIHSRDIEIVEPGAIADATHIHARNSVPVSWALPIEGRREEAGRFWAFFPTQSPSYLPGILNAPWKLNSDRNAIIGGEWNAALMNEAAKLVVEALPALAAEEDPARPLDAFPRRMDRADEVAAPLVDTVWTLLEAAAVVSDGTGALRCGSDLWQHPSTADQPLVTRWQSLAEPKRLRMLVHVSCLERQRPSRLNALSGRLEATERGKELPLARHCSAAWWFGMIATRKTEPAIEVLRLAESYREKVPPGAWESIRTKLAIIPTQSGRLVKPGEAVLAPETASVPDFESVAVELQANTEIRKLLKDVFRVSEPDDKVWESVLERALSDARYATEDPAWAEFWSRLRSAPVGARRKFLSSRFVVAGSLKSRSEAVHVRRRDGRWVTADLALLPGELVSDGDRSANSNVLVDLDWHQQDREILEQIGVRESPEGDIHLSRASIPWHGKWALSPWIEACRKRYMRHVGGNPYESYLVPDTFSMPEGYELLLELSGIPQALLTQRLLSIALRPECSGTVSFGHRTRPKVYEPLDLPHPLPWYLLKHGAVPVGASVIPLRALVDRRDEPVLRRLNEWDHIESALESLSTAFPEVPASEQEVRSLWCALIDFLATPDAVAGTSLTNLWNGAGKDGVVPGELPTGMGAVPLADVFVTTSVDLAKRAIESRRVVAVLDSPTMRLWLEQGARHLEQLIRAEWDGEAGPPVRLGEVVPELGDVLREDATLTARCQHVTGLHLAIDTTSVKVPCLMWDGTLLLDAEQLASLSRAERLNVILKEISASGWLHCSPETALRCLIDAGVEQRRAHVAQGATLAERLQRAVGGRSEALLNALGSSLRNQEFVHRCAPDKLATLVLAHLGPSALTAVREEMEAEGLQPPERWNTPAARSFVAEIGFPPEFASQAEARREAEELVSGPVELPPLHDFQTEVFEGLSALLRREAQRRRAVVSLPTGGGKTRVTVEAAVRLVLAPEGPQRSVLWVAQSDELCEQAVQAFRQVWVNLGARRMDLRVVRLWGGNRTPPPPLPDQPVAIVATIQTLNNRVSDPAMEWLQSPGMVVVDECHHAVTPSYSTLLRWLDADSTQPRSSEKKEPLIVGLSATPFRNDDEESRRLARRFDNCWLPADQESLYARLLSQGVLARAQYDSLDSGVGLTDEELSRMDSLQDPWTGLDFENLLEQINQRLAGNAHRNQRIIEFIAASEEQSILFFSNSVPHAEEMAARLNVAGIGAAAVSGSTSTVARRYFLERFQEGEVRVLCNHSVLTTGFDAPRTDMVLIARQVFSPVRYMQMVGRGLRGEKNGGTVDCRIVTVMDNLGRFEDRHPYHYCQGLYT